MPVTPSELSAVASAAASATTAAVADRMRYSMADAQPTTSGTAVDFVGIPSWAKRLTIGFDAVSTGGVNVVMVQLGTVAGVLSTGYIGSAVQMSPGATPTGASTNTGILLSGNNSSADTRYGHMLLTKLSGDMWVGSSVSPLGNVTSVGLGGGKVNLPGVLDRIRVTTFGGTDVFDGGNVSLIIEG